MAIMHNRSGAVLGAAALVTIGAASCLGMPSAQASTTSALSCVHDATYANRYDCTVSGSSDQATVPLAISTSPGVSLQNVGTTPMRSDAGSITTTQDAISFAFAPAFVASHAAPYDFSGALSFAVDNQHVAGPFTIAVGGNTYTTPGPGGYCGTHCSETQNGTSKVAWDGTDGRAIWVMLRGADAVRVGQRIDFVDHAGPGQAQCQAEIDQQRPDGSWVRVGTATPNASGTTVTASYTPTVPGAVHVFGSCRTDGTQAIYTDQGMIAGIPVHASTRVTDLGGDGKGAPRPVPMLTETYQVDAATLRSNAVVNRYAAADDDRRLAYRELGALWQRASFARYFSERHEYVTITVRADATAAQRMAAINARTRFAHLTTTATMGPSQAHELTEVVAWRLDTAHGARPVDGGLAWGPGHGLAQTFLARS